MAAMKDWTWAAWAYAALGGMYVFFVARVLGVVPGIWPRRWRRRRPVARPPLAGQVPTRGLRPARLLDREAHGRTRTGEGPALLQRVEADGRLVPVRGADAQRSNWE